MSKTEETIQKLLQPGERLVWWERPDFKYLRFPVRFEYVFLMAIGASFLSIYWFWKYFPQDDYSLQNYIVFYLIFVCLLVGAGCLSLLFRSYKAAWQKEPPYWKATLYAITDQRAVVIINIPTKGRQVLAYLPSDISLLTSQVRYDGAGDVTFGVTRQYKFGRYDPPITVTGGFFGIARVQEVVELLEELRARVGQRQV
jgi:hypothetical protein